MTTYIYKIPPNLPLLKGGFIPLFVKEGLGEIFRLMSVSWELSDFNYFKKTGIKLAKVFC
jgi:hypothetical protein